MSLGVDDRFVCQPIRNRTADAIGPRRLFRHAADDDPETQVVLPRIKNDVLALLWAAARGELRGTRLEVRS